MLKTNKRRFNQGAQKLNRLFQNIIVTHKYQLMWSFILLCGISINGFIIWLIILNPLLTDLVFVFIGAVAGITTMIFMIVGLWV